MTGIPIPGGTMAETQTRVARALAAAGLSDAQSEARWLIREALSLDTAAMLSRGAEHLSESETAIIASFVARRVRHEPLSRIAGRREFYGRTLKSLRHPRSARRHMRHSSTRRWSCWDRRGAGAIFA